MAEELTHELILTECAKAHLTQKQSEQSKNKLLHDIQQCVIQWLTDHNQDIEPDHIGGFVFPQTPTHEAVVVGRIFERGDNDTKPKVDAKPIMVTDVALKYITKRILDVYSANRGKSIAWTWPVLEPYFQQFHAEYQNEAKGIKEGKEENEKTKIRICKQAPRGFKTIGLDQLKKSKRGPIFIVVTFPIEDSTLEQMYKYLLDHGDVRRVLKHVKHESAKYRESIEQNVIAQSQRQHKQFAPIEVPKMEPSFSHSQSSFPTPPPIPSSSISQIQYSESRAVRPSKPIVRREPSMSDEIPKTKIQKPPLSPIEEIPSEPVEVKFQMKPKPAYTGVRITMTNFLGTLRMKHRTANIELESKLAIPISKSVQSHPFYLYLHDELKQCREQTYRMAHPEAPLTTNALKISTVSTKRKRSAMYD